MHVDVRKSGEDAIIVDLEGRLVAGVGDELLREVMNELVAEGWEKILLNLSRVTRIDSSGVGELVASARLARRFGGSVKIVRLSEDVRRVLHLSQILPVLDIYDSEDEAIGSFVG